MYRQSGIKISQFIEKETIEDAAVFPVVQDSTNYKITYGDLVPLLGATGTIDQLGGISGSPVLYQDGTINYIRNIESGQGLNVALNVDDGITISHNFTVNATGEPIMINESASSPTFISLIGGNGIALTSTASTIEIEATEPVSVTYALLGFQANATNTVIVTQSVPVLVAGTWVSTYAEGFLSDAAGRITYTGADTKLYSVMASVTADVASGSNKDITLYIAKNGAVITESAMTIDLSTGVERNMVTSWFVSFAQNDYIELYVANGTDAVDVLIKQAIFKVNG